MDIAKVEKNGDWVIIELGDGQVSGLPDNADLYEFYNRLKIRWNNQICVELWIMWIYK
jgi:hypothetical protein